MSSLKLVDSTSMGSQVVLVVKNPPASAGDVRHTGSVPGLGRSPGGGEPSGLQSVGSEELIMTVT